ncbi:MAG: cupin, partial [Catenulispora sp.]|nr:cupin [Catenulispora sp.]
YYRLLDRVHIGEATWAEVGETQDLYDNRYAESAVWAGRTAG